MKKLFGSVALIVCVLSLAVSASAGQFYGGKGYLHTTTGIGLAPGALDIGIYSRGYAVTPPGYEWLVSNLTSAVSANFGFSRHVELCITQTMYQDLNLTDRSRSQRNLTAAIPGEAFLRIKFANYNFQNNFFWGVIPGMRVRTSLYENVYLEPYQSSSMEPEITSVLSYFQKPMFPDEGYSAHANLGYVNHNDRLSLTSSSQELTYLASFAMSTVQYDYGVELYGNAFLVQPPFAVFGRENYMYITPMFTYKLFKGLSVTGGVDILAYDAKETTVSLTQSVPADWPNYAPWRVTGRIQITPSTAFYVAPTFTDVNDRKTGRERSVNTSNTVDTGGDVYSREQLFKWAIEERFGNKEVVIPDLDLIRAERRLAEEELARLKAELNNQPAK